MLFIQNGIRLLDAQGNLIKTAAADGEEVDPATPLWKAYSGDRVIFRTMMPADKPRNVSLTIHGHLWREQPKDALSREIPLQGGISVGNRFDMELPVREIICIGQEVLAGMLNLCFALFYNLFNDGNGRIILDIFCKK